MKILPDKPKQVCCGTIKEKAAEWRKFIEGPSCSLQCRYQARYEIEGKGYCTDHAGKVALQILFKNVGVRI